MKKTIDFYDFERAFFHMDRMEQFSYDGKKALFEWFEEYEESCETEIELDIIAICCEYTEYADLKEFQREYGEEFKSREQIEENTHVIHIDKESFLIQDF